MATYVWPCPTAASVSSSYGYRTPPTGGASSFHAGIDIPTSTGSPIVSIADGTVYQIDSSSLRGNYVRILHDNGIVSHYQHIQKAVDGLKVGHRVVQSEQIGISGSSGIGTGPHTDFRIYKSVSVTGSESSTMDNGATYNPLLYVAPAADGVIYPPGTGEKSKGIKFVRWIPM